MKDTGHKIKQPSFLMRGTGGLSSGIPILYRAHNDADYSTFILFRDKNSRISGTCLVIFVTILTRIRFYQYLIKDILNMPIVALVSLNTNAHGKNWAK
jgi:hypothetical protein